MTFHIQNKSRNLCKLCPKSFIQHCRKCPKLLDKLWLKASSQMQHIFLCVNLFIRLALFYVLRSSATTFSTTTLNTRTLISEMILKNIFRNLIKGNAQQFCDEPCLIKLVPSLSFVYTFIWLILFNCNVHVLYKLIGSNKLEFMLLKVFSYTQDKKKLHSG